VRATADGLAESYTVELEKLLRGDCEPLMIEPGDVVHVLDADEVTVTGYVHAPGRYSLRPSMTALDLVNMAGGAIASQADSTAFIRRRMADGQFVIIPFDVGPVASTVPWLAPGDVVVVPCRAK
jgi:protein involved in polysaccharide export with SLBB domain